MEGTLRAADWKALSCEVFQTFADAPLLTAGDRSTLNTMVIGWGGLGTLWGMPVCTVYVRPERYTYAFMERCERYTVSAFSREWREKLEICGRRTLWGMPVCTVYVRPERYTYAFMERCERYTVSAFSREWREKLEICGRKSGRDVDKVKACGLTCAYTEAGAPYFEEAELVIACRKLYAQDLSAEHLTEKDSVLPYYGAKGGWHRMYIGAVEQVLRK